MADAPDEEAHPTPAVLAEIFVDRHGPTPPNPALSEPKRAALPEISNAERRMTNFERKLRRKLPPLRCSLFDILCSIFDIPQREPEVERLRE
jgi:hypothetical protein